MPVQFCIPVIPSADLERSLRFWVDGLGLSMSSEMRKDGKLIFCMLSKDKLCFMLNQRAGDAAKPEGYEGIRLYWAPTDIRETRERLKKLGFSVSELEIRDYGQTEFLSTDTTATRIASASRHAIRRRRPRHGRSLPQYPHNCS